ncbi:MAG: hypothetical protein RLY11_1019 [Bacteroidota bacterium]|jgi:TrmH family RNA methyltransferase
MLSKSEIKYIQSLSHKKFREEEGLFLVEGVKMVEELIKDHLELIDKIYAIDEWIQLHPAPFPSNVKVIRLEDFELSKISSQQTPQQVLALVRLPDNTIKKYQPTGITLVLDQLQDPGNLGTIIRTCDWFGVNAIVCSPKTVDVFNPKVVQSAMGSVLRVPVYYTDLINFFHQNDKIARYNAVLNGESIYTCKWIQPCFIIIGNESVGISKSIMELKSTNISIPKKGNAESLNAAVAASVILSAIVR